MSPPFGPWPGRAGGGGGGVSQIIAGTGISISPPGGTGAVTITNSAPSTLPVTAVPLLNHLINGEFRLYQRQAPPTLTARASLTGRVFGPDRWTLTTQNAAGWNVGQTVTAGTSVPGLPSPYISRWIPLGATQKGVFAQVIESQLADNLSGATVTFQVAMRSQSAAATMKLGVLQLLAPGAVNVIPATFVSAFNANGVDPTFGANLSLITPSSFSGTGAFISGNGVVCPLPGSATFVTFSLTCTPSPLALNLIPVVFTDSQVATTNEIQMAAAGLFQASGPLPWEIPDPTTEELRCRRYYFKTFRQDTAPGQNVGINTGENPCLIPHSGTTASPGANILRVPVNLFFGATPIVTYFNPAAANAFARNITQSVDCTATSLGTVNPNVVSTNITGSGGTTVGDLVAVHMTVEAEL
jgi:hypothetical protein